MVSIIAFAGNRRSGKTLAASMVCDIDSRFRVVSFAGHLKDLFSKELGVPRSELDDPMYKEKYREAIQTYSESYKVNNPYYFVVSLFNSVLPNEFIVIDDLRFIQELEYVVKLGGRPFRVYADTPSRSKRGWVYNEITDNHVSETEMDLSQETFFSLGGGWLWNNSSQEFLKSQVLNILKKHYVKFS